MKRTSGSSPQSAAAQSQTPAPAPDHGKMIRRREHPRCIVCSPANPMGLGLEFTEEPDGSVSSSFRGSEVFEGWPGRLHGGVIAAWLDEAMGHCLLAHGKLGFTVELTLRYRHPVASKTPMTVRAWLLHSHRRLHLLRAELRQDDRLKATALGTFVQPPAGDPAAGILSARKHPS